MKSRIPFTWLVAGVVCRAGVLAPVAWGQQVTATITGKVTDPSGAAVANAKVDRHIVERGTQYPTTTNADGYYNLRTFWLALTT